MYTTIVALVVSLCLTSGQRTDVDPESCTYSFVVQSAQCLRDGHAGEGSEVEVASLRKTVASLSARLTGEAQFSGFVLCTTAVTQRGTIYPAERTKRGIIRVCLLLKTTWGEQ